MIKVRMSKKKTIDLANPLAHELEAQLRRSIKEEVFCALDTNCAPGTAAAPVLCRLHTHGAAAVEGRNAAASSRSKEDKFH